MAHPKFQTVSIWWFPDGQTFHYTVRGWYRGGSHLIERCTTLDEAVTVAFATDRKQLTVGLVPAKEELEAFANKAAELLGGMRR